MRVFIYGKKEKKISVLIAALLVAILFSLPWVSAAGKVLPIYRVGTNNPNISITFDMAWADEDLDEILETLAKNEVKATFFVTGECIRRIPDSVKKIHDKGHSIENHSNTHPHIAKLSAQEVAQDAADCDKEIKKLIGKQSNYYRAPYGEYNNTVITALKNYQVIQWDVDSIDWKPNTDSSKIRKNVVSKAKPGSIILFHVGSKAGQTADALKETLPDLKEKYEIIPLYNLIPKDNYHINIKGELTPA